MSLGATKQPELIKQNFKMLEDGTIKDQDVMVRRAGILTSRPAVLISFGGSAVRLRVDVQQPFDPP